MNFKDMKLATKLMGGFLIVLLAAVIIALMGYNGLRSVSDRVEKGDDVNRLVKFILETRQQEKNYILRGDTRYVDALAKDLDELIGQARVTRGKFDQQVNKDQMDAVIRVAGDYHQAFKRVVDLNRQKDETMDKMRALAREALSQAEAIRGDQKQQLEIARGKSAEFVEDKLTKADDANRLIKWGLECRRREKDVRIRKDESYIGKHAGVMGDILTLLDDLAGRMKLQLNRDQVAQAKTAALTYQARFQKMAAAVLSGDRTGELAQEKPVSEAAAAFERACQMLRDDQKAQLARAQSEADSFVDDKLGKADDANRIVKWFIDVRKNEKEFIISNGDQKWRSNVTAGISKILDLSADLKSRFKLAKNTEQINAVIASVKSYAQAFDSFARLMAQQDAAGEKMVANAREAIAVCEAARTDQKNKMVREMNTSETLMGITTVLCIIAGLSLSWFIMKSITKPLNEVIEGLTAASDQVASASAQVSSSSQSLAEGASEQAASIEETSSSLEQMASMTKQNATNANEAKLMMDDTRKVVDTVNAHMTDMAAAVEEISRSSEETGKIIKTIDEIAFQTNLLALNAAVEAARAGDAGSGFAVVADEVRNLAMRAADAAKNTANLIESTIKSVETGNELTQATIAAFQNNMEIASKVGHIVGEISTASNEQASGIEQVNRAVAEMDKVVQQNASGAEESASASEEMNAQSEQMKDFVRQLAVLVAGGGDRGSHAAGITHPAITTGREKGWAPSLPVSKARKTKEVRPEEVIPLDNEFTDF